MEEEEEEEIIEFEGREEEVQQEENHREDNSGKLGPKEIIKEGEEKAEEGRSEERKTEEGKSEEEKVSKGSVEEKDKSEAMREAEGFFPSFLKRARTPEPAQQSQQIPLMSLGRGSEGSEGSERFERSEGAEGAEGGVEDLPCASAILPVFLNAPKEPNTKTLLDLSSPSFLCNVKITTRYVISDVQKQKRAFVVGVVTIFLVVCFLSLVQSLLSRANLILLKLAEDQVGQYDFVYSSKTAYINFTSLNDSLAAAECIHGSSPRWILPASVFNIDSDDLNSTVFLLIIDTENEKRVGIGKKWSHRQLGVGEIHLTDSLARKLNVRPQVGDQVTIEVNLTLYLQIAGFPVQNLTNSTDSTQQALFGLLPSGGDMNQFLFTTSGQVASAAVAPIVVTNMNRFRQDFSVIDAIESPEAKYPAYLGNVIILELSAVERQIKDFLQTASRVFNLTPESIAGFHLSDYSQTVISMLEDRTEMYLKGKSDRNKDLLAFTDEVYRALNGTGNNISSTTPVEEALEATEFMGLLLQEIFFMVIGVLIMLAVLLIYSLLISGVDERTFEYGMLRSLGMRKRVLILLLATQAFYFAIPAIIIGFLVAYILYIPIDFVLSWFVGVEMDPNLTWSAVILGLVLGFGMPLFGMLLPIRRALGRSLRDALDVYHNVSFDSVIKITKLQDLQVSLTEILVSLLLVIFGVVVYYLVPLSYIFGNLSLFLRIFSVVLLGMVLGQVLLSQGLDFFLEIAFGAVMMWGSDLRLRHIVAKNLAGHRRRNKKTATMFTLCLGFVVFAATLFVLQSHSISMSLEWTSGADIVVTAVAIDSPLPREDLASFLNTVLSSEINGQSVAKAANEGIVESFSFITFPLQSLPLVKKATISAISPSRNQPVTIYGVENNLQDTVFPDFIILGAADPTAEFGTTKVGQRAVVEALYDDRWAISKNQTFPLPLVIFNVDRRQQAYRNQIEQEEIKEAYTSVIDVLVSDSLRAAVSVDVNVTMQVSISYNKYSNQRTSGATLNIQTKPLSFIKKFSGFPAFDERTASNTPLLISFPQFKSIYSTIYNTSNSPLPPTSFLPMQRLLVVVSRNATDIQVEGLVNAINSYIPTNKATILNVRQQLNQTKLASLLLTVFFDVVAVIGLVFSFFVLWLSFTSNVRENSWEYGVLRAVGLVGSAVTRLYIYESLAIVVSSIVLGTLLGIFTAIVLTLQFNLFSQMPFLFYFPTGLYFFVVILSLVVAVAGSYLPSNKLLKKEIALIMRY